MNITIKKLTPALAEDFLTYFDTDAFSDHEEWAGCYCLESHIARDDAPPLDHDHRENRREKARELVEAGIMTGYLLYDGDKAAGWCNAGDKASYGPVCAFDELYTEDPKTTKIKIIYCFDIAPNYRGKGLATLAAKQVLADAKAEGYQYVEGYPFAQPYGDGLEYPYTGPVRLYEKLGFTRHHQGNIFCVMQKKL